MQQFALHPGAGPTCHVSVKTQTVFVVDRDNSVREALALLISSAGWQPRCFASMEEFLAAPRAGVPSCLILDVTPPCVDSPEIQRLLAGHPELPSIFVASFADVRTTVKAMRAGAFEVLTKPCNDGALLNAIRCGLYRSEQTLAQAAETQLLRDRYTLLSPRERQVMALAVAGMMNKQIGRELGISEITVKAHRGKVMRKMRACSIPDLVRMELRLCAASCAERLTPETMDHRYTAVLTSYSWRPSDVRRHLIQQSV